MTKASVARALRSAGAAYAATPSRAHHKALNRAASAYGRVTFGRSPSLDDLEDLRDRLRDFDGLAQQACRVLTNTMNGLATVDDAFGARLMAMSA